jgi:hypothetical protein
MLENSIYLKYLLSITLSSRSLLADQLTAKLVTCKERRFRLLDVHTVTTIHFVKTGLLSAFRVNVLRPA